MYEDPNTGAYAYKVGYCGCGCGEEVGIRTIDLREVVNKFGFALDNLDKWKAPREPLKHKLIRLLGGKVDKS
jgi:hypothetical protein